MTTRNTSLPYVLSCRIWSFYVKRYERFNSNNNRISIAPYGRIASEAQGKSDQFSVKVLLNRTVLSLDLETVRESLMRTVCGSEFQTVGGENRKVRLEKSVLMSSSGMAAERHVLRFGGVGKPEWMCSELCTSTANFYVIRCWTGNQCSWCSDGLMWKRLGIWSTIRAALF